MNEILVIKEKIADLDTALKLANFSHLKTWPVSEFLIISQYSKGAITVTISIPTKAIDELKTSSNKVDSL